MFTVKSLSYFVTVPKEVFDKWGVPGIALDDLKPRYQKYIQENNVHLAPAEELNENNRLFEKGCRSLGWSVEQFPINTKGCVGLGTCNLGCAIHAKQGTAIAQIPNAEKGGVQVIPFCRVDRIAPNLVEAQILPAKIDLRPRRCLLALSSLGRKRLWFVGAVFSPLRSCFVLFGILAFLPWAATFPVIRL
ncbi:GMC family oxidoreductase N-terminal domain-containing protein [Bdellovibrionota bacterium FG-2]